MRNSKEKNTAIRQWMRNNKKKMIAENNELFLKEKQRKKDIRQAKKHLSF